MPRLSLLKCDKLRNLSDQELQLNPRFNVFYGENGAGKTSLLEAVSILSTSRSFRTNKTRYLIMNGEESLTVFARFQKEEADSPTLEGSRSIGVSKYKGDKTKLKLDGNDVNAVSELAHALPVIAIEPNSFDLLEGGPKFRRALLDWLVFHVKPGFFQNYKDYSRCLKQRNMVLRSANIKRSDLASWDTLLCRYAVRLDEDRRAVFNVLIDLLQAQFKDDLANYDELSFSFKTGWSKAAVPEGATSDSELAGVLQADNRANPLESLEGEIESVSEGDAIFSEEALGSREDLEGHYLSRLKGNFDRDRALGYTSEGSHRFDIVIKSGSSPVNEKFSRGQKKQLIIALFLAVTQSYRRQLGRAPILLLDDLPSELDRERLERLIESIYAQGGQCLITTVDPESLAMLKTLEGIDASWFHVKHGEVTENK